MSRPKCQGPLPGQLGGCAIMGIALLIHEPMVRVVAIDVGALAGSFETRLEFVDGVRRAPVVSVCEVSLQRDLDVGRLGDRCASRASDRCP